MSVDTAGAGDRYARPAGIEAWTIAVVGGSTVDEVLRAYGGDPSAPIGDLTFAGLDARRAGPGEDIAFHARLSTRGDLVVVLEADGYSGAFPAIARRCSAGGGAFFSVYWNVHAAGFVTQAVDGVITARYESLYPLAPDVRAGERRPDWAVGPEVEAERAWPVCPALLERETGVAVRPQWLAQPLPTYRIPEPYGLYADVDGADRI